MPSKIRFIDDFFISFSRLEFSNGLPGGIVLVFVWEGERKGVGAAIGTGEFGRFA